jgi:hypothetical protein
LKKPIILKKLLMSKYSFSPPLLKESILSLKEETSFEKDHKKKVEENNQLEEKKIENFYNEDLEKIKENLPSHLKKSFKILHSSKIFEGAFTENSKKLSILQFVVENYLNDNYFDFQKIFPHCSKEYFSYFFALRKLLLYVEELYEKVNQKSIETNTSLNLIIKQNTEWSSVLFKIKKGTKINDYFLKIITIENLFSFILKFLN